MAGRFDAIVVGLGAMGSAATYQLATRGQRVLGIDMYDAGHTHGSSHGHHRLIRRSHWDTRFRPLVDRTFELWRALEEQSGAGILRLIGEVALSRPNQSARYYRDNDNPTYGGYREVLDADALRELYPGFRLYDGMAATYERDAGYLRPETGIAAHLQLAQAHGAVLRRSEEVTGWEIDGDGVRVTTTQDSYLADRLVIAAGPWSDEQLRGLGLPLQVVRIVNVYFEPERPDLWTAEQGAPDFLLSVPEGDYYGMPSIEGVGLKIGRHDLGQPTTPRTIRREVDAAEENLLRDVLDTYMPGASGRITQRLTCMYTMTPDENYIIERHPEHPQVTYGCGFSGTGYKFSPVIGEILADLALDGQTRFDISLFSSGRFRTDV